MLTELCFLVMLLLWVAAGWSAWKKYRVGKQFIFLVGSLVVFPITTFLSAAELSDRILEGEKAVGPGSVLILLFTGGFSLVVWLIGYWVASLIGWWFGRRNVEA